jgi:hypothetical protein
MGDTARDLLTRKSWNQQRARLGQRGFPEHSLTAVDYCHATLRLEGPAMDELLDVRNITVSIRRSPRDVYAFVANGENIPRWAAGLGSGIRRDDDGWIAQGPLGEVRVHFAPPNDLGVADHDVTLPSGETVHNPVRIIPNRAGSTVIFSILRRRGVSGREFDKDIEAVQKDLNTLKGLLEAP